MKFPAAAAAEIVVLLHAVLCFSQTPPAAPSGVIRFEDIALRAGVNFVSNSSPSSNRNQPETMVGGLALFDYDGDGYLDIYVVNGAAIPSLEKDGPQYRNRLYHNNGNLTFTDVTDKAGLGGAGYGMGVAVGDYDNDGWPDIYLANVTGNQLFHNNGNGTFTDATAKAGVAGGMWKGKKMWSVAAAWVDYNNDGLLDLFVSNYVEWEVDHDPVCVTGKERDYCDPKWYKPLPNTLYRNNGDGTFSDVSAESGIAEHLGKGMGVAIADFDGDGYPDIFVANDKSPNFLFHNLGGKKFEEIGEMAMVAVSADGKPLSSMGVDFRDVNNDGKPDIWYTALEKETFPLLVYDNGALFDDATTRSGLSWATMKMSGWGNGIYDLDNDGWKDLLVVRGHVLADPERFFSWPRAQPNSAFRNLGNGKFEDVSATAGADFLAPAVHRGAAFGDLDNDGRIDVVVTTLNGQLEVFHNVTESKNHWVELQLRGNKSNRMGIGARIKATGEDGMTQYNHVTTSVGYASSSDSRVHFGLGSSSRVREIEILWPSGIRQVLKDVQGDRTIKIEEPNSPTEKK
ncbi:MAG: CRTAC1 family protein [Acidobacteriia bacterium]|nr:CRTAC1 family protein [Terriglobia bacterium]